MELSLVLHDTELHVKGLFEQEGHDKLLYHNLAHTQEVVKAAKQIADYYQLNGQDYFTVSAAAWFHDTGYLYGVTKGHEEKGAELAAAYLTGKGCDGKVIEQVQACIKATRLPQSPAGLLEQIVCDADLFHLGTESYSEKSKLLRQEIELLSGEKQSGSQWRTGTINFLQSHHYHTTYAQVLLNSTKLQTIEQLEKKEKKKEKDREKKKESDLQALADNPATAVKEEKPPKADLPTRGIETMFRLTSSNHLELSAMADSKANIMISVNSIIISVLLSVMLRRLEDYPNLKLPTVIFLAVNVATIIFAILATRPKVTSGIFTREDIENKRANLLFFGNFHKMKLEEYEWGMKEIMKDKEFLYTNMIRDIYFLGAVLGRKYKLLRISYNIFMYGMVISVLAFAAAVIFFPVNN
jgi:predicted metal-dependent HD superfamily phosphohydrolase